MNRSRILAALGALSLVLISGFSAAQDLPQPPAAGVSARVDAIRKAGALRVGVLANSPWLIQNTEGQGEPWRGPAWLLAKTYAKLLNVELQEVPVSSETRIPVLASNQVDLTITALSETPERLKVLDFINYSTTSNCLIGRKDNPKLANITSIDELNSPDMEIVYVTGGPYLPWLKARLPNARMRGVTDFLSEVIAGHADLGPYNKISAGVLLKKNPDVIAFPRENNCQDSKEQLIDMGMGVDKNQPEFLAWTRAVADAMKAELSAEEARAIASLK
ncbi:MULTISPECIES: transporter substrate-binding domain-containing protein [unclassified Chelatococcus]|uniref:substrate-binding periplasmic protein n=1 Tax=unclassified Chelatococcus TaxID=2638111 RepID=UPI001BCD4EA2|nr:MULTISPECIES: transporter substrate-binding domain-containing protein [unclassified Chelatococcus]MBS7701601.1 transporter substrate-binding domain-containing protein [Chelatococcus sp. YT9]MBX3559716.1 transporter substrate-binding domain-containing protein [Chelatococcus sp.]